MAINPISGAFPDPLSFAATPVQPSANEQQAQQPTTSNPAQPLADRLAAMEASLVDSMLTNAGLLTNPNQNASVIDSFTSMLGNGTSTSSDPLLDALNGTDTSGASTGDPLLDALNSQDANTLANQMPGSPASDNSLLDSSLSSFLTQQASTSYLNAQALENLAPGLGGSTSG